MSLTFTAYQHSPIAFIAGLLLFCGCLAPVAINAQADPQSEQQLESITASNNDNETEDDSYIQLMEEYRKHPVNLNSADEAGLKELKILTALQIENILSYRRIFGKFISVYELQAVPGLDIETIQKLRPYVSINETPALAATLAKRLRSGEKTVLLRISQQLERSKGYLLDPALATNYYKGSPQKLLLRYKYAYKNLLSYGFVAEKDAGEQFFKGGQKSGFDFYSAHFYAKDIGIIKTLVLGDFTVNLGQGLIQWQGMAFKKSTEVLNIKRESAPLRPYNSAGEVFFHRGAGMSLQKKRWRATAFVSYRNLDANLVIDTTAAVNDYVSSLQTSGYHRTRAELADKAIQRQIAIGLSITKKFKKLNLGLNAVSFKFKLPVQRQAEPYNSYAFAGNNLANCSLDYSYTFRNLHLFGEFAIDDRLNRASVNGLLIAVAPSVDMAFLYRNISRSYHSLYSNAFTETGTPANERGLYAGISLRPLTALSIDAYADVYRFPWLRYRVDAVSSGCDLMIKLLYTPSKTIQLYTRFRNENKGQDNNPEGLILNPVIPVYLKQWRMQVSFKASRIFTLESRMDIARIKKNRMTEEGVLCYADLIYKPMTKHYSFGLRLQYFETGSYDTRLYAFENDVLYSFSIPVFYGKGYRYYLNMNYALGRRLNIWIRFSQTISRDKSATGTGLDETDKNHRSEVKLQLRWSV